jgi:DNA-binding MltR family transcriptional regulator
MPVHLGNLKITNTMKKPKAFLKEWYTFSTEYQEVDDRACAILGTSYIDYCLEIILLKSLANPDHAGENLFDVEKPLGTFSAKIELAYCLSLIPKSLYRDLHLIRKIRNEFAHGLHGLTFNSDSIKPRCLELETP